MPSAAAASRHVFVALAVMLMLTAILLQENRTLPCHGDDNGCLLYHGDREFHGAAPGPCERCPSAPQESTSSSSHYSGCLHVVEARALPARCAGRNACPVVAPCHSRTAPRSIGTMRKYNSVAGRKSSSPSSPRQAESTASSTGGASKSRNRHKGSGSTRT